MGIHFIKLEKLKKSMVDRITSLAQDILKGEWGNMIEFELNTVSTLLVIDWMNAKNIRICVGGGFHPLTSKMVHIEMLSHILDAFEDETINIGGRTGIFDRGVYLREMPQDLYKRLYG